MRIKKVILCSVFLCVVSACGKRIENHQASTLGKSPIKSSDDNHLVTCHSGEESCPEYIAFIKNKETSCNAVLVDERTLITSSYCFKNQNNKSLCESMEIIFPATEDHEFKKLECEELVFSQSVGKLNEDIESKYSNEVRLTPASVAYIKISTSTRAPIQLSSKFQLNESLKIQTFSFDIAYESELFFSERECYVSLNTYASPLYQIEKVAPAALTNCLGQNDELGAPLLNQAGELVAISGSLFSMDEAKGLIKRVKWNKNKKIRSVLMAQKAACFDIENLGLASQCQNLLNQDDMNQKIHELFFSSLDISRLANLKRDLELESLIRWRSVSTDSQYWADSDAFELKYEPICKTSELLPEMIPYFKPRFKIKHGWRLGLGYIYQSVPLKYQASQIPNCL